MPTGELGALSLSTDGTPRSWGTSALTQELVAFFDVTDVFRVTIGASNIGGAIAAVGSPQVLCSSDHHRIGGARGAAHESARRGLPQ